MSVTENPSQSPQDQLVTTYGYDALDNLTAVSQGAQTRSFRYNSLKQLVAATNPEIGAVVSNCLGQTVSECYVYDANGNLSVKRSGGVQIDFLYDPLNRIKRKSYSDGTPQVDYAYDTARKGCIDSVTNSVSTMAYTAYNAGCVVTQSRQTVGGQQYPFSYSYNLASQLVQETYPSGRVVSYHYDALGHTDRVGNGPLSGQNSYATEITYTPHGALSQMKLGVTASNSGWTETWAHDPKRLQPSSVNVKDGLLALAFYYCPNGAATCTTNNGNLLRQTITRSNSVWTQDYSAYDAMNRLLSAQETSAAGTWSQAYGYDRYGNWWLDNQTGSLLPLTNETPRNATWYAALNNHIVGWNYDRGNITSILNMSRTFTYDGENRQKTATINGVTATYTYDGEGRRITKTAGGVTTTYVYDAFNHVIAEYGAASPVSGTQYVSVDHLGSTRLVTDANGAPIAGGCHDFLPFGGEIVAGSNGRGSCFPAVLSAGVEFTGKERDAETGLDFFGARYMSSAQGRFTSADPYVFQFAAASHTNDEERQKQLQERYFSNPQSWNKYAYGLNNPLKFIDPNGKCSRPSNQKEGETGICIEAFIAQDWFGTPPIGRGDQRTFSGTDASLTARSRIKITVDKNGKITSKEVESARSGIVVKGFGFRGDTEGTATAQPQGNGSSSVHVDLWGRNGEAFLAPLAPSGVLQGHFNFNVSASGKVDLVNAGSSVTGFPSWGIYAYPPSGGVQTVKEIPENKIEDLQKPPRPIK